MSKIEKIEKNIILKFENREINLPEELKGLNVYDAGTNFKMIITSIASYTISKHLQSMVLPTEM